MKKLTIFGLIIIGFLHLYSCSSTPENKPENKASVWFSSQYHPKDAQWWLNPWPKDEIEYTLDRQKDLPITKRGFSDILSIKVNPEVTYQTVLGIGTSLEDTTTFTMQKNRSDEEIKTILRKLIDPDQGIGFNLFRITIGTSDFSDGREYSKHPQGFYSYQDDPNEEFSIQNDIDLGIIRVIKLAIEVGREVGNEIKIFASAWSPPAWMKTSESLIGGTFSESLIGGTLKPGLEHELAQYYRKFLTAYKAVGIPIYAVTMQNEPNFVPRNYPGMHISWEQERDLVIACYEEFKEHGFETKIWINDHNFDYWENADKLLSSLEEMGLKHYVDSVAFHDYSGDPGQMGELGALHPDTNLTFTETSVWGIAGMERIAQYFRNGSNSYVSWVTMSNQDMDEHNQGPYNSLGRFSPTLFIEEKNKQSWYKIPEYYLLGQYSKFVTAGAKRIYSDPGSPSNLTSIAFLNPDGTISLIVMNQTKQNKEFRINTGNIQITAAVPGKSVATFVWDSKISENTKEPILPPELPQNEIPPILASSKIQAEECDTFKDVRFEGSGIGYFDEGDWLEYKNINFDHENYTAIKFQLAVDNSWASKQIEVRLDSISGPIIALHTVDATRGWFEYSSQESLLIEEVPKGVHNLYIIGKGGDGIANVDWFNFK